MFIDVRFDSLTQLRYQGVSIPSFPVCYDPFGISNMLISQITKSSTSLSTSAFASDIGLGYNSVTISYDDSATNVGGDKTSRVDCANIVFDVQKKAFYKEPFVI